MERSTGLAGRVTFRSEETLNSVSRLGNVVALFSAVLLIVQAGILDTSTFRRPMHRGDSSVVQTRNQDDSSASQQPTAVVIRDPRKLSRSKEFALRQHVRKG